MIFGSHSHVGYVKRSAGVPSGRGAIGNWHAVAALDGALLAVTAAERRQRVASGASPRYLVRVIPQASERRHREKPCSLLFSRLLVRERIDQRKANQRDDREDHDSYFSRLA